MKQETDKFLSKTYIPTLEECLARADETKELVLAKNALEKIPGLLDRFFAAGAPVCVICDENTDKAAGQKVRQILLAAGKKIAGVHTFPGEPRLHAEYSHVRFLKEWIAALPDYKNLVPISVGAGTVNDLVKCASSELGLAYLSVPTASSVDGFTPNGAALLMDGFKHTVPCPAPRVLAADIDVIAAAPSYLASSGFGDLASKLIAGTDWIVAEKAGSAGAIQAPPVDPVCWAMTQNGLLPALEASITAPRGDGDAIKVLFQSLAITGFSMQYYKNARPVSGAEHLFSHVWEMEDLSVNGAPVTHGHKVAVGTLAATAFTETFFADPKGPPAAAVGYKRPSKEEREAETAAAFKDNRACDKIVETALVKMADQKTVNAVRDVIADSWTELRERVLDRLPAYGRLKDMLGRADCPLTGETIGLARSEVIATARKAQMMRNKYTILDLAWDLGCFETILKRMEDSATYLR